MGLRMGNGISSNPFAEVRYGRSLKPFFFLACRVHEIEISSCLSFLVSHLLF